MLKQIYVIRHLVSNSYFFLVPTKSVSYLAYLLRTKTKAMLTSTKIRVNLHSRVAFCRRQSSSIRPSNRPARITRYLGGIFSPVSAVSAIAIGIPPPINRCKCLKIAFLVAKIQLLVSKVQDAPVYICFPDNVSFGCGFTPKVYPYYLRASGYFDCPQLHPFSFAPFFRRR